MQVIRLLIRSEAAARARYAAQEQLIESDLLARNMGSMSLKGKSAAATKPEPTSEEIDQGVRDRLDAMGFKIGWALSER